MVGSSCNSHFTVRVDPYFNYCQCHLTHTCTTLACKEQGCLAFFVPDVNTCPPSNNGQGHGTEISLAASEEQGSVAIPAAPRMHIGPFSD